MTSAHFILPGREAHGEGDHAQHGGGANGAAGPSIALRAVPLPIAFGDSEDSDGNQD